MALHLYQPDVAFGGYILIAASDASLSDKIASLMIRFFNSSLRSFSIISPVVFQLSTQRRVEAFSVSFISIILSYK